MTSYIDDKFMKVFEDNGILILKWKESTKSFSDDKFKIEAIKFEEIIKQLESKNIIVDMRNFHYELSKELLDWRAKNIINTYNEIGVKKFAFISGKEAVNQDSPENTFITKYFITTRDAKEWLNV